jgi:hypothetical protein
MLIGMLRLPGAETSSAMWRSENRTGALVRQRRREPNGGCLRQKRIIRKPPTMPPR